VPFFEQLYRQQHGQLLGPLRALHYGDSHVAADEWTGDIRERLQQTFGDGGSGYSLAGRPWNSYRRFDVKSGSTRGWHSDGLVGRTGDGIYGLGGVSMTASSPRQSVYLVAEGQQFELYYLQQPGGGAIQIYDNGAPVERISTDGETAPSYFHYDAEPGAHRLEAETLDRAPVRLFGWVAEKPTGVTYEALGINGASASMMLDWNGEVLKSNIERRNPALIVLSYGTNEAGRKDWTLESYRDMFTRLLDRLRADAPTATILVVGPPDRAIKVPRQRLGHARQCRHDRGGRARGRDRQGMRVLGSARQDGRQGIHARVGVGWDGARRLRAPDCSRLPHDRRRNVPRSHERIRSVREGSGGAGLSAERRPAIRVRIRKMRVSFLLGLMLAIAAAAFAQTGTGTISGKIVTLSSGGHPVPNAPIVVKNTANRCVILNAERSGRQLFDCFRAAGQL